MRRAIKLLFNPTSNNKAELIILLNEAVKNKWVSEKEL